MHHLKAKPSINKYDCNDESLWLLQLCLLETLKSETRCYIDIISKLRFGAANLIHTSIILVCSLTATCGLAGHVL